MFLTRGKSTGGSSTVNAQMWVRGCPQDYDQWAKEAGLLKKKDQISKTLKFPFQKKKKGDDSWSFKSLLPLWKDMEDFDEGSDEFRGRKGPIKVRKLGHKVQEFRSVYEAYKKSGFIDGDYNADSHTNIISFTQENNADGKRR